MVQNLKQNIGYRVRLARKQKGMTQADLAEAIDKSFETISNIERGKTAPNFLTLWDISLVVGAPMKDFFDWDEEEAGVSNLASQARHKNIVNLRHVVAQLNDDGLALLLKLGTALADHNDQSESN